jgi:translation initiation factor IF-2
MGDTNKAVRISKVARELNVGTGTIVEFLEGKGIAVENSPNAKIEPEAYDLLLREFQQDKKSKELSKNVTRKRAERETITIESGKTKEETEQEEDEVDLETLRKVQERAKSAEPAPKPKPATTEEPAKVVEPVKAEEPVIPEVPAVPAETPVEKETPASKPVAKPKVEPVVEPEPTIAQVEPEPEKVQPVGPKVVGKVNLDDVGAKKKKGGSKKEEAPKPAAKTPPAAPAPAPVKAPEPAPKVEAPRESLRVEPEKMRAEVEKLTGPTVVGRITLPVTPERKPRPEDDAANKKRKRKRVNKVDVEKQAQEARKKPKPAPGPGGQGSQGGQGGGGGHHHGGGNQNQNRNRKPEVRQEVSEADIQKEIKETLARLSGGQAKSKSSKFRKARREEYRQRSEEDMLRAEEERSILKLTEFVTVSELASMMGKQPTEIISACMSLGIFASINQRLDAETITVIADEFGYKVEFVSAEVQQAIQVEDDNPDDLVSRPPIVTVMGHVDHGKTSLLDYVRKANVIAGEAGGITQHIGAYSVQLENGRQITFLDTPGHEAFTAMRARGAQVTDLAIIVIAADDSVMPQTREAINHAQAANIPMIFALNKVDKPDANTEKIREELANMNILVEDWGGKFQSQEISAKKGLGINELLEKVLLEADMLELKANPKKRAHGTVIESSLDKGRGYVTTLLVEAGTLRVGDAVLAGQWSGKVKAMFNERGQNIEAAGPSAPVSMLGLSGAPSAGDKFNCFEDEKEARAIAIKRQQLQREQGVRAQRHITIEEIGRRIALGEFKELNLIVKGDVDGSIEALSDSLQKLSTEKIHVNIIHKAVGQISESDVLLASASDAIVIGFQVRPSASARRLAEKEEIQIKLYSVIYQAIDEVRHAMEGLLEARMEEKITGTAEVREAFKITKVGTIAGCFVLDGKINRNSQVRVIRDGIVIYTGTLGSLKRFKDDVKEVSRGFECGLNIDRFNDIKVGDNIEAFEEVSVKQTL